MTQQPDLVDKPGLFWAHVAFVDLLAFVVIDHVLLEVSLVAKNFPAKGAGDFINNVRVTNVIF